MTKLQEPVTMPIRQYKKRKHIVCVNTKICNQFGNMPTIECAKHNCEFARAAEYVINAMPTGFLDKISFEELGI